MHPALAAIPEEVRQRIPPMREIAEEDDPMVWVRYVGPIIEWTWYVCSMDIHGSDVLFFGWVLGEAAEVGSFYLSEMFALAFAIELDLTFQPCPLSRVMQRYGFE